MPVVKTWEETDSVTSFFGFSLSVEVRERACGLFRGFQAVFHGPLGPSRSG